jgi:hypothetical protein
MKPLCSISAAAPQSSISAIRRDTSNGVKLPPSTGQLQRLKHLAQRILVTAFLRFDRTAVHARKALDFFTLVALRDVQVARLACVVLQQNDTMLMDNAVSPQKSQHIMPPRPARVLLN